MTIKNCVPTSTGNELGFWRQWGLEWQLPIGPESLADLQHAEALEINATEFPNIHVHWESESSDCDGRHGDYGISMPNADEYDEHGAVNVYDFWTRIVEGMVFAFGEGTLTLTGDSYKANDAQAEWQEVTDEGYRARHAYICTDECETPTNTVYDQFAQMAGY